MKEYIEKAVALEALSKSGVTCNMRAHKIVASIQAADVVEVKHGRWEKFSTASGIVSRVMCSVCAGTQPLTFENMPYCPACGARMDKEDEHD